MGLAVKNRANEDLGKIEDLVIDERGHVRYAAVTFGGFLGFNNKLFAVPWKALTLDTENERFTLNVPKASLSDAPGFDKDHWPSMIDKAWATGVHKFYGTPYGGD